MDEWIGVPRLRNHSYARYVSTSNMIYAIVKLRGEPVVTASLDLSSPDPLEWVPLGKLWHPLNAKWHIPLLMTPNNASEQDLEVHIANGCHYNSM